MSFTAEELFGSDNEGFSDEENFSSKGKDVFRKLSSQPSNICRSNFNPNKKTQKDSWKSKNSNISTNNSKQNDDGIREIYSGIKVTNPTVSSEELRVLMQGRKMIKLSSLKANINKKTNDVDDDWVTIGIVVNKITKVSKNGNEYSLWKLSDLKSEKMASLFLFGKVNEKHWKMSVGSVIGLLNATIMSDNKGGKEYKKNATEICSLTIDDADKLLHIGTSKDMGYCKAQKKNGEVCGSLIAKSEDEFCIYHIKSAYRKFSSKRAEIQTSYSNKEPEDLYFGNNYTPNVTLNQKNIVLEMKSIDKTEFKSKKDTETKNLKKIIANPLSKAAQNLAAFSSGKATSKSVVSSPAPPISAKDIFAKLKEHNPHLQTQSSPSTSKTEKLPALAKGYKRGQMIDLPYSAKDTMMSAAKRRAIEILKNRPTAVPKIVPNTTKSPILTNKSKKIGDILKRVNSNLNESNEELKKEQEATEKAKSKLIEDALGRKSVNQKVVKVIECEEQDKYFTKLEKKERYENRLAEIKELSAKVVSCSVCNYTASSQSDYCKSLNHSAKFHQSTKRFFSCKKCKTRTFSFDSMLPTKACTTCGSISYEKAAMIHVKTETKLGDDLQIRGEEIQFLNSVK